MSPKTCADVTGWLSNRWTDEAHLLGGDLLPTSVSVIGKEKLGLLIIKTEIWPFSRRHFLPFFAKTWCDNERS